jgi:hypothetical protein
MPSVDDRISKELRKAAPRPGGEELFQRLEIRMRRRRFGRRLGSAALAIAVIGGTLAGYLALDRAFRGTDPRPATPSVTQPQPSATQEPGRDLGLGFRVCDVRAKFGIDFFGDGSAATVWTGIRVRDGSCPIDDPARPTDVDTRYLVAVDFDHDSRADAWTPLDGYCTGCEPFAATDFDADGTKELIVLLQYGTTPQYGIYEVTPADGSKQASVSPILVRDGSTDEAFPSGEPISFFVGGDEGFAGQVECEGYPDHPIVVVWRSDHPIEGSGSETRRGFVTRLRLVDGAFAVISSDHFTQPVSDPVPFDHRGSACGVDFEPDF